MQTLDWVLTVCQCRITGYNTGSTVAGMLTVGEAVDMWGQGVYGNSLYLLLSFSVNLKLLKNILKIF